MAARRPAARSIHIYIYLYISVYIYIAVIWDAAFLSLVPSPLWFFSTFCVPQPPSTQKVLRAPRCRLFRVQSAMLLALLSCRSNRLFEGAASLHLLVETAAVLLLASRRHWGEKPPPLQLVCFCLRRFVVAVAVCSRPAARPAAATATSAATTADRSLAVSRHFPRLLPFPQLILYVRHSLLAPRTQALSR